MSNELREQNRLLARLVHQLEIIKELYTGVQQELVILVIELKEEVKYLNTQLAKANKEPVKKVRNKDQKTTQQESARRRYKEHILKWFDTTAYW